MPSVQRLTAVPIMAGETLIGTGERGQDRLRGEKIDQCQKADQSR